MSGSTPELSVDTETGLDDSLISHDAPNGASGAEETLDRYAELQTFYRLSSLAANSLIKAASASEETGNDMRRAARFIDYGNQTVSRSMVALRNDAARAAFLQPQINILKLQCDIIRSQVVRSETTLKALSAIELVGQKAGRSFWDGVPLDAHTINLDTDSIALCLDSVKEGLSASDAPEMTAWVHEWKPPSTIELQLATSPDESGNSIQELASSLSSLIESAYIMGLAFKQEHHADHPEETSGGLTAYETDLLKEEGITDPTCLGMGDHVTVLGVNVKFLGGSSDI